VVFGSKSELVIVQNFTVSQLKVVQEEKDKLQLEEKTDQVKNSKLLF
jgi:hypothetical protein